MDMNKNHEEILEKLENEIITRSKSYSYHREYARAMAKKDIEIERMKEYVSDARKEKIQNRKMKEEIEELKKERDELKRVNKIIRAGAKTELMEYGMEKGRMIYDHNLEIDELKKERDHYKDLAETGEFENNSLKDELKKLTNST